MSRKAATACRTWCPCKKRPGRQAVDDVEFVGGSAIQAADAEKTPYRRQAVLIPETPFGTTGGTLLRITLRHNMRHSSRNLGRFRLSVSSAADPQVRHPNSRRPEAAAQRP